MSATVNVIRHITPVMSQMLGLTAPVFTPLTVDGNFDPNRVSKYVQHLAASNVSNIFVTGTTGEFPSFSVQERKVIQREWIKQGKEHLSGKVVVHVGTTALNDAQELAKDAVENGADAIASVVPYYMVPATLEAMIEYFKELTKAVPETPFLYYHFPTLTKCAVDLIDFIEAALKEIPTFTGLKYTDEDMDQLRRIRDRFGNDVHVYNGFDYLNFEAIKLGVKESICATFSFMPGPHLRMREAFNRGQIADAEKEAIFIDKAFSIIKKHSVYGLSSGLKDTARAVGLDVGKCRLPLKNCSDEKLAEIKKELEEIDFFEKCD